MIDSINISKSIPFGGGWTCSTMFPSLEMTPPTYGRLDATYEVDTWQKDAISCHSLANSSTFIVPMTLAFMLRSNLRLKSTAAAI